jgi:putative serine protease PepD
MAPAGADRAQRHSRTAIALVVVACLFVAGVVVLAIGALGGGQTATVVETIQRHQPIVAADAGMDAVRVYRRAAPGVVDLTVVSPTAPATPQPFGTPGGTGPQTATGTGFLIDRSGDVLTAAHVVADASSITATLPDGTSEKATLLGHDNATDVAVVRLPSVPSSMRPLTMGSVARLQIGSPLAVIGDPFTYERSLSTGVVSGLDRTIQAPNGFTVAHAIQTDATINPGNSGGPVLDAAGDVVGIVDQIATSGADQASGVGFAVPIDIVGAELAQLERGETVRHAYLGVSTAGIETTSRPGVVVQSTLRGGPAAAAGIRAGDSITRIDNTPIETSSQLVAAIAAHRPGDRVTVTLTRGSSSQTVKVTLAAEPTTRAAGGG